MNNRLGAQLKELAVEGKTDKFILEVFLTAGENAGYWKDWSSQLLIEVAGKKYNVIEKLKQGNSRIWGLIDHDALPVDTLAHYQQTYPQLLILPRWTIENYFIDPDELIQLLPPQASSILIRDEIERQKSEALKFGALWHVFTEAGIFSEDFPNPRGLCKIPMPSDAEIYNRLSRWNNQLNPDTTLKAYLEYQQSFLANPSLNYAYHIHGKNFFLQVVQPILNKITQKSEDDWKRELLKSVTDCPADLIPVLRPVVA